MDGTTYMLLKHVHVGCAVLSISFFIVRGYWMMTDARFLQSRPTKILPHVIDTVLLASAIGLSLTLRQYPFVHDWLTVKVLALVVYILLGTLALKRAPTRALRIACFAAAIVTVLFIVSVARAHHPLGWFY